MTSTTNLHQLRYKAPKGAAESKHVCRQKLQAWIPTCAEQSYHAAKCPSYFLAVSVAVDTLLYSSIGQGAGWGRLESCNGTHLCGKCRDA